MPETPTVFVGSDHAGFGLKAAVLEFLQSTGRQAVDMGAYSRERHDYPCSAQTVCRAVLEKNGLGILVCGSGIGMSIAANRFKGIRAALCTHEFHARGARAHNNANVICLGERITAPPLALELLGIFLNTEFEGGRHAERVSLLDKNA